VIICTDGLANKGVGNLDGRSAYMYLRRSHCEASNATFIVCGLELASYPPQCSLLVVLTQEKG